MRKLAISWLVLCGTLFGAWQASAQLTTMGVGGGFGGDGGGGGITYTQTDAQVQTYSFATSGSFSINIGTASADRIVIVGVRFDVTLSPLTSSPTLNGTAMNLAIGNGVSGNNNQSIWYLNVPSGSSATFAWSNSGAGTSAFCVGVGILKGHSGGGSATPNNTGFYDINQADSIGPISTTVSSGGISFLLAGGATSTSTPVISWTGSHIAGTGTGDAAVGVTNGNRAQLGIAHGTASDSVSASSTGSFSFDGAELLYAAWAP